MATRELRPAGYASTRPLDTDSVPWRLWEKSKRNFWNPADIDFSQDPKDWATLTERERHYVAYLAGRFMIGEEAVTLDILPLVRVMADEGRVEETMFLTTFAFEEAKHVDFFRRWFDAVGFEIPDDFVTPSGIVHEDTPRAMRRLDIDRSPEAILDAALTYNQVVEGVLAISGYKLWHTIFTERGILPGMQEGLGWVQRDERRHIAYGTYLCRRILASHPELWGFVEQRLEELKGRITPGSQDQQNPLFEPPYPFGIAPERFLEYAMTQFPRRLEVMEVARRMRPEDVAHGTAEEDLEEELAAADA